MTDDRDLRIFICNRCRHEVAVPDRPPPWCPKCGADLTPNPGHTPAPVRSWEDEDADEDQDEHQHRQELDKEGRERFSIRHFAVAILLIMWGSVRASMSAGQDPTDKIFAAHPRLMKCVAWLHVATCVNGLLLCLAGYGLTRRKPWAYAVATGCAALLILGGVLFLIVFNRIGTGPEIEDGVAKVRFIRENLDMFIGLVEGGFLLRYLYRHGRPAA